MTYTRAPACMECRHYERGTDDPVPRCAAYPDGIPDAIFFDGNPHTAARNGDHGIRFEPLAAIAEAEAYPGTEWRTINGRRVCISGDCPKGTRIEDLPGEKAGAGSLDDRRYLDDNEKDMYLGVDKRYDRDKKKYYVLKSDEEEKRQRDQKDREHREERARLEREAKEKDPGAFSVVVGKTTVPGAVYRVDYPLGKNLHCAYFDKDGNHIDTDIGKATPDEIAQWSARAKEVVATTAKIGIDPAEDLYVRYGRIPKGGRSLNHATRELEKGTSVYSGKFDPETGLFDIADTLGTGQFQVLEAAGKTPYLVRGEKIGTGSDGEPVLKDAYATHQLKVTADGLAIVKRLRRPRKTGGG
ncbi:MAG: hypothetical protein GXY82_00700 [Methanospirillum sp.]|nr:hypothetical protein [Methanospirillum sp.]